jgi:polyisoprenoid-binding protein YceI
MRPMTIKTSVSALAAVAALAFAAAPAMAQATHNPAEVKSGDFALDPAHGKITWSVNHLGYSIYVGQFYDVQAKLHLDAAHPAASTLDVTIDPAKISTANEHLDAHLKSKDFLDVAAFPTAGFHATKIERTGPKTARITGDLTLHGVTKPVTLEAEFLGAGANPMTKTYEVGFEGHAVIKRSDFGVSTFVPLVADEVKLSIEGEFKAVQ